MSGERRDDESDDRDDSSEEGGLAELAESVRDRSTSVPDERGGGGDAPDLDFSMISETDSTRRDEESEDGLARLRDRLGGESNRPSSAVAGASDVLLLGPPSDDLIDCIALTAAATDPPANILLLAVTRSAERRLSVWRTRDGWTASNTCVVTFGGRARRGSELDIAEREEEDGDRNFVVERVSDPSDLTRLGITISRRVEDWQSDTHPTRICFDSLTGMLQYVEPKRLFRFLNVLQDKLEPNNVTTHYHMAPEAHDQQVVNSFKPLFDVTLRRSPDGNVEIVAGQE